LAEDHSLRVRPVEEAERLRADHQRIEEIRIKAGHEAELGALGGKSIELIARIDPEASREVGLKVLRSSDDAEYTRIVYAPAAGTLTIDTLHSSQLEGIRPRSPETAPLNLEDGEALELRVFIDRSVIEVFANGRLCLAVRVYPKHDDSRDIAFFAQGGDARLLSLDLWKMKPIWPEFANEN